MVVGQELEPHRRRCPRWSVPGWAWRFSPWQRKSHTPRAFPVSDLLLPSRPGWHSLATGNWPGHAHLLSSLQHGGSFPYQQADSWRQQQRLKKKKKMCGWAVVEKAGGGAGATASLPSPAQKKKRLVATHPSPFPKTNNINKASSVCLRCSPSWSFAALERSQKTVLACSPASSFSSAISRPDGQLSLPFFFPHHASRTST